jgi:hypothetical protein
MAGVRPTVGRATTGGYALRTAPAVRVGLAVAEDGAELVRIGMVDTGPRSKAMMARDGFYELVGPAEGRIDPHPVGFGDPPAQDGIAVTRVETLHGRSAVPPFDHARRGLLRPRGQIDPQCLHQSPLGVVLSPTDRFTQTTARDRRAQPHPQAVYAAPASSVGASWV